VSTLKYVYIGGENRYSGQFQSNEPSLSYEELEKQVSPTYDSVFFWGGEPTLRKDLPQLIKLFSQNRQLDVAMRTDAVLFSKKGVSHSLKKLGLTTVYVTVPSLKRDACEWLLGKGVLSKTIRGIRNSLREGLQVIVDVPLTRSTMDHLDETVAMVHRLGAKTVLFRMMEFIDTGDKTVMLAPRFGVIMLPIQVAISRANQLGVTVVIEGIPDCILGDLKKYRQTTRFEDEHFFCSSCSADCSKLSKGYVSRFGWSEIWETQEQDKPTCVSLYFTAKETSRSIRKRLIFSAQSLVQELWLMGDFSHKDTYQLLRESLRLSINNICLSGDLKPLQRLSKLELLRLRNIHMITHLFQGEDLDQEVLQLFERWKGPQKRLYVQVESVKDVIYFDQMFQQGKLPMAPFYRIEGTGKLEDFLAAIPLISTASGDNLLSILPFCFHRKHRQFPRRDDWMMYNKNDKRMKKIDLFPHFRSCKFIETCQQVQCCVGLIEGYSAETIEAIGTDDK
jgi:MoaA/NifB/PqqE/SkfB family radical SAM enzyme